MALNANRTSNDFTFKHSGQPDEYGVSVGDYTVVQSNFDSRAIDNLNDLNNTKNYIRSDIATKADLQGVVVGQIPPTTVTPYGETTTNSGNAYSISTPTIASLVEGYAVKFKCNVDSSGAATLNWAGTGAKSILKGSGAAMTTLKANSIYTVVYNGTNFILQGEGGDSQIPKLPNLIKNGSFENGFNCYNNIVDVSLSTNHPFKGTNSILITNNGSQNNNIDSSVIPASTNDKIYITAMVYLNSYTSGAYPIYLFLTDTTKTQVAGSSVVANTTKIGQFQRISAVYTIPSNFNNNGFIVKIGALNTVVSGNLDCVYVTNLTAVYGAGNEPTKSEMDTAVQNNGGWWDSDLTLLTADATATAADIISTKTAYVNGQLLTGTYPTNKKNWATGTAVSGSTSGNFTSADGSTTFSMYPITVTGLTFKPSTIILKNKQPTYGELVVYDEIGNDNYPKAVKIIGFNGNSATFWVYNMKGDVSPASVTSTGFTLPSSGTIVSYTWIAYE